MKTDPFDDAIRRKLEGINPSFQDKNWTQFQRFMGSQGFPPSLWQTPARWLQPTLMAAAVAGMVITTVWQYRTTQSLTEHVQTLTKTVERMEQNQLRLQQSVTAKANVPTRIDTVYLTRSAPSGTQLARATDPTSIDSYGTRSARQRVTDAMAISGEAVASAPRVRTGPSGEQQRVGRSVSRQFQRPSLTDQLIGGTSADATDGMIASRPEAANDQLATARSQSVTTQRVALAGRSGAMTNPAAGNQSPYTAAPAGTIPIPPESGRTVSRRSDQTANQQADRQFTDYQLNKSTNTLPRSNDPTLYSPPVISQVRPSETVDPAVTALGTLATVQPLRSLPLSAPTEALAESWQRHLRRVRYRSPYMTSTGPAVAAVEAKAPAQHTTPSPVTFRLGVGGEIGTAQSGLGVYAEVIVANRWTIGTGLSQINWAGDEYSTEQLFMAKTKRDFRKDYPGSAPPIPVGPGQPRRVMDINRSGQSLVVPLQLGYRIGLGNNYVLTPSLGLNIGLTPHETVTYGYEYYGARDGVREALTVQRPPLWYSNWVAGISAERQWGRITGQLSTVVLAPLANTDACLNSASLGLRGRLFYRF